MAFLFSWTLALNGIISYDSVFLTPDLIAIFKSWHEIMSVEEAVVVSKSNLSMLNYYHNLMVEFFKLYHQAKVNIFTFDHFSFSKNSAIIQQQCQTKLNKLLELYVSITNVHANIVVSNKSMYGMELSIPYTAKPYMLHIFLLQSKSLIVSAAIGVIEKIPCYFCAIRASSVTIISALSLLFSDKLTAITRSVCAHIYQAHKTIDFSNISPGFKVPGIKTPTYSLSPETEKGYSNVTEAILGLFSEWGPKIWVFVLGILNC